tara:strand:+ start:423 stop:938 length:516 start_codon:yes stop_codon:yes gene_type:complete
MHISKIITLFVVILFTLNSCGGFKYAPARDVPVKGEDRARKNIEEGRGVSIGDLRRGGTTYEFSSSNPMWRASLETLDFLPLSVVDYSGGIIVTDWYSDASSANSSIKISLRFLSNEIRADSLKVIIHKKNCSASLDCKISILEKNKINEELHSTILRKAALLKKADKKKK